MIIELIEALRTLGHVFNNFVVWLFLTVFHVTIDPRIVNIASLLLVLIVLWKAMKKIPLLILLILSVFMVVQIGGLL